MAGVLDEIFAHKAEELKSTERNRPLSEIKNKLSSQRPEKISARLWLVTDHGSSLRLNAKLLSWEKLEKILMP